MIILIKDDVPNIARKLEYLGINSIEVSFNSCGEDYCDDQVNFVFEVPEDSVDWFVLNMLDEGRIIELDRYEYVDVRYDNISTGARIHPKAIKEYVKRKVSNIDEVDVYVNDKLYLVKVASPRYDWKE